MLDLIEQHRAGLDAVCRQYSVAKLELFGSAADGTFDFARSDLDFLVEFQSEPSPRIFHGYFDLRDDLERLFGRKVDLVMPRAIRNRYLLNVVNQQRKLVYAA